MAPEVLNAQNHTFSVDFFALGVISHECTFGHMPYNGKTRKEVREQILLKPIVLKKGNMPKGWSSDSMNFINGVKQL